MFVGHGPGRAGIFDFSRDKTGLPDMGFSP
jgi:hypothetical protein